MSGASLLLCTVALGLLRCSAFAFVTTTTTSASLSRSLSSMDRTQQQHQQRQHCQASVATMVDTGSVDITKSKILQLAAVMDRGSMANPGISNAYLGTKNDMRSLVQSLAELRPVDKPLTATQLSGSWELVYATVELFRASPFFQMVEAGYDNPDKSNLFFKLHQLQTGSWGASSIGRVTQMIDLIDSAPTRSAAETSEREETPSAEAKAADTALETGSESASGSLESAVDLIILPLTSVPLVGFWKLLPTFGGCIATKAACSLSGDNSEVVELVVESTKLKGVEDVPLLPLAGPFLEGKEFPTGEVAKKVMGDVPVTKQTVMYIDDNLRVMQDKNGELYIYARPLQIF